MNVEHLDFRKITRDSDRKLCQVILYRGINNAFGGSKIVIRIGFVEP